MKPRNNLAGSIIGAIDEYERIRNLQQILEIGLENLLDTPTEASKSSGELLFSLYKADMELRLDELRVHLQRIRQLVIGEAGGVNEVRA